MEIVVLDGWLINPGDLSWAPLQELGNAAIYDASTQEEALQRVKNAQAILLNRTDVGEDIIAAAPNLKYIGVFSTGTNKVDLQAAAARGIPVCNIPSYSTNAVAQHAIALLLEITNQVGNYNREVQTGNWEGALGLAYPTMELTGKTMGIIGFGEIGRATARIARALGMQVLATGSRPSPQGQALADYVGLDTLLAQSDVISLHCPLKPDTEGLINAATLAKIKTGAILINTARGGLLVEQAVADALQSGQLAAAGLDVAGVEPILPSNPLLHLPNCIISPHVAWTPKAARSRCLSIAVQNLKGFISGNMQNRVV